MISYFKYKQYKIFAITNNINFYEDIEKNVQKIVHFSNEVFVFVYKTEILNSHNMLIVKIIVQNPSFGKFLLSKI